MKNKLNQIIEAIQDPKTKVVSFDVFDTLILRPFWNPTDLFMLLDREAASLFHTSDIIRFSEFRKEYELLACDQVNVSGREDLTLEDIYNYLKEKSPFPDEILEILMEKEKEMELRFCYARKSTLKLLKMAVDNGKRVVAISDMYLSSGFIKKILEKCAIADIEEIYVSGEIGLKKRSGHLYEYVAKELGVKYQEIVHIGDNEKTDVKIPRKLGLRTFYYPRTVSLMRKSSAYRHAYDDIRSSFSNYHAMEELGLRCLLAVAANIVYDDPFRADKVGGDYAGDSLLFGTLALGMYCFSQGLWVYQKAKEKNYNQVLFFSRDGYLPYLVYELIRKNRADDNEEIVPEALYVRTSRKALLPLLLTKESGPFRVGTHIRYLDHSPKSVAKIMSAVLKDDSEYNLEKEKGVGWSRPFPSEADLVSYVCHLSECYVDTEKAYQVKKGFISYFRPFMKGRILTYDIGYNIRNEIILRDFFSDVHMDACFTHCMDDVALRRSKQGDIKIHVFYPSAPFVSCPPRELFMTENAPSCKGYTIDGRPMNGDLEKSEIMVQEIQDIAINYVRTLTHIFNKEILDLPLQLTNACHPFEAFLHTPCNADRKWIRKLNADNDAASVTRQYQCYDFWRRVRMDYWGACHHLGKNGRYIVLCLMLLVKDRYDLKKTIRKRVPNRLKKYIKF